MYFIILRKKLYCGDTSYLYSAGIPYVEPRFGRHPFADIADAPPDVRPSCRDRFSGLHRSHWKSWTCPGTQSLRTAGIAFHAACLHFTSERERFQKSCEAAEMAPQFFE